MTKEHTPEEIKNWLSNIGGVIGIIALKYIVALEEENTRLKERIDNLKDELEYSENYGKRVQKERHRLVNENAELREQCSILADCNTCISACKTDNIKAKEILKQWLQTSKAGGCDNIKIIADTEQFLKEK